MILPQGIKKISKSNYSKIKRILPYKGQKDDSATLYVPNSVESIDYEAFDSCKSLTSVVLPNGVKSIDYGNFYNCRRLHCILNNTHYKDQVLQKLNDIPHIDIEINDHIIISTYLYDYFEEPNIIEIIIEYSNHDLLSQLIDNNIDVNKIEYI